MREFWQQWRWRCLHCCGRQSWLGHISSYLYGSYGSGLLEGRAALSATAHVMFYKHTVVGNASASSTMHACSAPYASRKGGTKSWISILAPAQAHTLLLCICGRSPSCVRVTFRGQQPGWACMLYPRTALCTMSFLRYARACLRQACLGYIHNAMPHV